MWSLVYLLIRTLVALIIGTGKRGRDDGAKDLEILVLRHQLRVLRRTSGPPKLPAYRPGPARGNQPGDPA
jgi:hypothetical protein